MRLGRRIAVSLSVSILVTSVAVGDGSASSPLDADWLPELRLSDQLQGPIVIKGRVEGATAGTLTLLAWPTSDLLADAKVGDNVKIFPVGKAVVAGDGSFALRVDPAVPMQEVIEVDGIVNFDLMYQGDSGFAVYSFPRRQTMTEAGLAWTSVDGAGDTLEVTLLPDGSHQDNDVEVTDAADNSCGATILATWNEIDHVVGEIYTGPNATGDFVYLSGSSSTVGVGYSTSGNYGTWSLSGTTTKSSTFTENFPLQGTYRSKRFITNFGWRKYRNWCTQPSYVYYQTKPYAFQGGQSITNGSPPSAVNCVSYVPGGSTIKDTGTAVTWSAGVEISYYIGIDLTSRTGFNTQTKLTFNWVDYGQLCGSNDYPPQAARVVAK